MCNSDRSAWAPLAQRLAAAGVHSLALDYRGYGESGGERSADDFRRQQVIVTEKWPGDVDAALAALLAQPGVDRTRVGAAGGSCGVNQAVRLARRHPEVKTLALFAGNADQAGQDFLAATPWMPLVGIASHDDGPAVGDMQWLLGFSSHPANRLLEYPRGGHGTELFAVHADLAPAVAAWFEQHLVKSPVTGPPTGAAAVAPRPPSPSVRTLQALREPGGAAALLAKLRAGERPALPPENAVNTLGYELLGAGRAADAVAVFEVNVAAHPRSANALDSLGDGLVAAGRLDEARAAAQKAIEAIPNDPTENADYRRGVREASEAKLRQLAGGGGAGGGAGTAPAPAPAPGTPPAQPPLDVVFRTPVLFTVPGMDAVQTRPGVVYRRAEVAGAPRDLTFDLTLPARRADGARPPVVVLISGSGVEGPIDFGKSAGFASTARALAASGLAAVSFEKRYVMPRDGGGGVAAGAEDLAALLDHLRAHAGELGVDAERMALWAYSGGGWLLGSALGEGAEARPYLRALVGYYPVLDLFPGMPESERQRLAPYLPLQRLRARSAAPPPLLIARAGLDQPHLNAGIDAFAALARERGGSLELLAHEQGRHGFDVLDDVERTREILRATIAFLRRHLAVE
jgi:dienelactone hydrolase